MAQKSFTRTQRREMHLTIGEVHPSVLSRVARALKRGHRRLVRRASRQQLRSPAVFDF